MSKQQHRGSNIFVLFVQFSPILQRAPVPHFCIKQHFSFVLVDLCRWLGGGAGSTGGGKARGSFQVVMPRALVISKAGWGPRHLHVGQLIPSVVAKSTPRPLCFFLGGGRFYVNKWVVYMQRMLTPM